MKYVVLFLECMTKTQCKCFVTWPWLEIGADHHCVCVCVCAFIWLVQTMCLCLSLLHCLCVLV